MNWAWRKLLAVAAGGIGALLLGSGAYAADSPLLVPTPSSGPPGTTVTARGTGFCASCGPVEIDFVAQPVKPNVAVLPDGSFQTTFPVPGGAQAGTDAINAYQQGKLVTQTSFDVTPSAPGPTTTATPRQTGSPAPRPSAGGGSGPGGAASPTSSPTTTTTANAAGLGPTAGTGRSSGATSATATAIVLSALALLVVAIAVALLYRRFRAKPLS
jgi:hypothetical protein